VSKPRGVSFGDGPKPGGASFAEEPLEPPPPLEQEAQARGVSFGDGEITAL
jgi:hypothetical protein